ncbi:MAG TPA: sugar phosphate nucleotidyltransferase [Polyangiaceae bacterium]|nr:sugar phosphate nucleotidyltransferase [Polyangiaceae bacterium]
MKVVLFCGGLGMRLREYSDRIPKPLAEIGHRPLMWHLMKYYAHYGHKDFILCLGYGGAQIKKYFLNYDESVSNDFVLNGRDGSANYFNKDIEDWRITFVDTGANSSIGERLRRVRHLLKDEEVFLANYADGLSDLNLREYVDSFMQRDKTACFVSVRVPQTFHIVHANPDNRVTRIEHVTDSNIRINGGFFVLKQQVFDHLFSGEELVVEAFSRLIEKDQLIAHPYDGFWQSMDTFKDKIQLDDLVARGPGPWQVWLR